MADKRWISADLSVACSGVALWAGVDLRATLTIRKESGRWMAGAASFDSETAAWCAVLSGCRLLVYEDGLMHHARAAKALSEHRGKVLGVWQMVGAGPALAVNVATWRKVARQTWGQTFPPHHAACKELAVWLVRQQWGRVVSSDEADAVMVGHWALKTRRAA